MNKAETARAERREIAGKGKAMAEKILAPGHTKQQNVLHADTDVEPERMILEPGAWWRGRLSQPSDGTYGPQRYLYGAVYGQGAERGIDSGAAFWIPNHRALGPVFRMPNHAEVTVQYLGEREFDPKMKPYKMWRVWSDSDIPQPPAATMQTNGDNDLPF